MHTDLIRNEAQALFSRISFAKTSVSDIAKACGLGKGTIYLYFKSKDDIVLAIIEERIARIEKDNLAFFDDSSLPVEVKIKRFFEDMVDESFALKDLIFGAFENVQGRMFKDIFFKYGRYFEWCVDRLTAIIGPYRPDADDLREDAKLLLELMIGRMLLFLVGRDWNDKEGLKAIMGPLSLRLFDSVVA